MAFTFAWGWSFERVHAAGGIFVWLVAKCEAKLSIVIVYLFDIPTDQCTATGR